MTSYSYNIFSFNDGINSAQLIAEIEANLNIVKQVLTISIDTLIVVITFESELTVDEKTELDLVVSKHKPLTTSTATVSIVKIAREVIPTGGSYRTEGISFTSNANTVTVFKKWWDYPISILRFFIQSNSDTLNDSIEAYIGKDAIIGYITNSVPTITAWNTGNYTIGQVVTVVDPVRGTRTYTCIKNTENNESPSNTTFWRRGIKLVISQTALDLIKIGFGLKLTNGQTTDDVGDVSYIDVSSKTIHVSGTAVNQYAQYTQILLNLKPIKSYTFTTTGKHEFGKDTIVGSYLPTDTIVTISYTNVSNLEKTVVGSIDYLY